MLQEHVHLLGDCCVLWALKRLHTPTASVSSAHQAPVDTRAAPVLPGAGQ